MLSLPTPSFLNGYWQNGFALKQHLQEFLNLDLETLEVKLEAGHKALTELGKRDFDWQNAAEFYRDKVGEAYLLELGAWHLKSQDYIGDTLRLIADQAKGRVLDFGGGIGTHAIAAALCPEVEQVVYCDINPINRDFVQSRVSQMGLGEKVLCCLDLPNEVSFDTILCFDVLEHLPDPSEQLLQFHKMLSNESKVILNWYFFKGFNQEFPFHLDEPEVIESFFITLGQNFIEVFHPYLITARCYSKLNG